MITKTHLLSYTLAFLLIVSASLSRLLPHPLNVTPLAAMALFGGVYLDKRFALIVPFAAMIISDYFIGFSTVSPFVYAGFLVIGFIGIWLQNHKSVLNIFAGTLTGSIVFFVVTNFGVWIVQHGTYPMTLNGLIVCYIAAIPFFRNTLAGDLAYVIVMFGIYELLKIAVKKIQSAPVVHL